MQQWIPTSPTSACWYFHLMSFRGSFLQPSHQEVRAMLSKTLIISFSFHLHVYTKFWLLLIPYIIICNCLVFKSLSHLWCSICHILYVKNNTVIKIFNNWSSLVTAMRLLLCEGAEDEDIISEMRRLLSKIEEMKNQRSSLENQLREQLQKDDITSVLVAQESSREVQLLALESLFCWVSTGLQKMFERPMGLCMERGWGRFVCVPIHTHRYRDVHIWMLL